MQMKKNLGKIFLLLLLSTLTMHAKELATYTLSLNKNKKEAFVKEPIEITFTAQQKDHSSVMFFFVSPKPSSDYTIKLLTKSTKENSFHNNSATFRYILFPLKAKNLDVEFQFYIKTANDQALAQAYVTDHDEGKGVEGDISYIDVKPLTLHVKALSQAVDLVGDFTLNASIDKKEMYQYDNVNLHYRLYGSGYNNSVTLLKSLKNVEIFSDIQNPLSKLTPNGYKIKKDYTYALSAKNDFTIPSIKLKAYSPSKKQYYTLQAPAYNIKVKKFNSQMIVDKQESPQTKEKINFESLKQLFIYIFIFMMGYVFAKLRENQLFARKENRKFQDIKRSQNAKELMLILVNSYKNKNIDGFVKELENIIYEKREKEFKKVKKRILKEFM